MSAPIPDDEPSPGEALMADTAIALALDAEMAAEHGTSARLTWAGLHALPALAAMLDVLVTVLVTEGRADHLLNLNDVPSLAYAVIHLLDEDPALCARLLGECP